MGILSSEEISKEVIFKSLHRAVLPDLSLHLANILVFCAFFSHLTGPRTLPSVLHVQLFAKMDPTAEACGCISMLIIWWHPLLFGPPKMVGWHHQHHQLNGHEFE